MFAGSDMSINLLSANHGNAWNVLMPGILVVGGVAWRGVGQGDGALQVKTRFSHCSLSLYVWASQEKVTIGLWVICHLFGVCYGPNSSLCKVGLINRQFANSSLCLDNCSFMI